MKTFWYQSLLTCMVTVAVGCAGPQTNMSIVERWLADGYPPEYIDGLDAGCAASCRELLEDKAARLLYPSALSRVCTPMNLKTKSEQGPRDNRIHQQGWADGKALVSFAIDAVRQADAQLQMQVQAGVDHMKLQRNMQLENLHK